MFQAVCLCTCMYVCVIVCASVIRTLCANRDDCSLVLSDTML